MLDSRIIMDVKAYDGVLDVLLKTRYHGSGSLVELLLVTLLLVCQAKLDEVI